MLLESHQVGHLTLRSAGNESMLSKKSCRSSVNLRAFINNPSPRHSPLREIGRVLPPQQ
jgi:hypothetical protein